ncbi:hypothetical protein [Deinococcus sp. ME38]|uniref:hypothetical protein n=1 Tax=Deinococcus sp. ME38 TaxID=3400344 RepID=UPI003B5BE513
MAIQERRELVGYRTQSALARAVRELEKEARLPGNLKGFSQQWLSGLEDDRNGQTIASAHPQKIRALAYMLRWSAGGFEEMVDVPIGSVPGFDPEPTQIQPQTQSVKIPDALLLAAREYGAHSEFAGLRDPVWQNFMAILPHRYPPTTAAEWLAAYLYLRERLEPPK